ncbi:PREDICTED: zinc finger protein ZOP1 isoform X1 [Camelina sativa]|uniref:Zinc finger protein ZOP1 isoform X1 n=1 Tax=Camelina sativa TaxID=90675 RepID=A0ABM0VVS5_CAMSA|nr:PREDICTED: zinc finger protein ZOP1 isoform X1 [Camelina sativa]
MTEYWVSQGNKWCDFCKIWIQNNPTSIRNHELGKRHRECVDKKLTDMREKSAAKDKELKKNEKLLQQIEAKATRSYQKDIATAQQVAKANGAPEDGTAGWMLDSASGYYYNQTNGLHYDSKSGFYYSDSIGHWVTQDEAYAAVKTSSDKGTKVPLVKKPMVPSSEAGPSLVKPPGRLVSASLNPKRAVKGAPSSVDLGNNKRKRQDEKPKKVSAEEKAALRAREAARKRVDEREKPLLGLYNRPF